MTGTLYTDILTDQVGVPLWISTTVFAALLAAVFGVWYARERTLSIHSIVTTPREAFYWLAVLVTFALGTATGDWTLELTGWGPGKSVLLPLALIAIVTMLWRLGANAVLTFWLAYILTRPLGANIGDWLGTPEAARRASASAPSSPASSSWARSWPRWSTSRSPTPTSSRRRIPRPNPVPRRHSGAGSRWSRSLRWPSAPCRC